MAPAHLLNPVLQIGREIRIELATIVGSGRLGRFQHQMRAEPGLLPEQRTDDRLMIERRKAEAVLQSVRHGAVRR